MRNTLFGYPRRQAEGLDVSVLFTREDQQSGIPMEMLRQAEQDGSVSGSRWVDARGWYPPARQSHAGGVPHRLEVRGVRRPCP